MKKGETLVYKLTDRFGNTMNMTGPWKPGAIFSIKNKRRAICSPGVLHGYRDPYIASIFNEIHANFWRPRMMVCVGKEIVYDGFKSGYKSLKVIKRMAIPKLTKKLYIDMNEKLVKKASRLNIHLNSFDPRYWWTVEVYRQQIRQKLIRCRDCKKIGAEKTYRMFKSIIKELKKEGKL